jgi:hypothetical protein
LSRLFFSRLKCLTIYSLNRTTYICSLPASCVLGGLEIYKHDLFWTLPTVLICLKHAISEAGTLSFISIKGRHVPTHFSLLENVSVDTCKLVHINRHNIVLYASHSVTCHSCTMTDTLRAISIFRIPSRSTFQIKINLCCHFTSICVNIFFFFAVL